MILIMTEPETIRRIPDTDKQMIIDPRGFHFGREMIELAAFTPHKKYRRVADLGCGDGILSILLGDRPEIEEIWAFDLDPMACDRAERNAAMNHLAGRIRIYNADVRRLQGLVSKSSFDLAIMNPPFFPAERDYSGGTESERRSRQELHGGLPVFLQSARYLLAHSGDLVILYHPSRLDHLFRELARFDFQARDLKLMHHHDGRALFVMLRAVKGGPEGLYIHAPAVLPETIKTAQGDAE